MALRTYADLLAAVPRWAMRTGDLDFEAMVPDIVSLAETRINRTLRLRGMETTADLEPDDAGGLVLPADFLEFRTLDPGVRGYEELELVTPGSQAGYVPGGGVGEDFTISGNRVQTFPAANGPVRLTYYARVPPLSAEQPTNWLLTSAPDLYLYACLVEGALLQEDDPAFARWAPMYERAVSDLKAADASAKLGAGRSRVRQQTP